MATVQARSATDSERRSASGIPFPAGAFRRAATPSRRLQGRKRPVAAVSGRIGTTAAPGVVAGRRDVEIDAALSIRALFATPAQSITAPVTVALDVPASCEPEAVTVPRKNVELSSERISDLTIVAFL